MFQREIDWKTATALICDVLRGSASLAVDCHAARSVDGKRQAHFSSWTYSQTQPHQSTPDDTPRLFSLDHLKTVLADMSKAEVFFAYETSAGHTLRSSAKNLLAEFSTISLSVVTLTVGEVVLSWALVSLANPRDLLLWKMKYHLRDVQLEG